MFYKNDNQQDGKKQVPPIAAIYTDDKYITTNNMRCIIKSNRFVITAIKSELNWTKIINTLYKLLINLNN